MPSVKKEERGDEAREFNQVFANMNAILLELLETSNGVGRARELHALSAELARKSERLEGEESVTEGSPKILRMEPKGISGQQ